MIALIVAIVILLTLIPFIGRKIYLLETKILLSIFFIGLGAMVGFNIGFSYWPFNLNLPVEIGVVFRDQILSTNVFFFGAMLIFYIFGGIGFVGSIAEKTSELIEEVKLFSDLKKRTSFKSYLLFLFYGYIFIFGIFSANKVISLLLGIEFRPVFFGIREFYFILFENVYIVIIGISLYNIKAFKFGYFSREFWKQNLSFKERENTLVRYLRKFLVIFFFVWAVYTAVIIFLIDIYEISSPFGEYGPETLQLVFYSFSFIEIIYFYMNKEKLVDPLRVQDKDFKKKIDENIVIEEDDEIKF
jgi:hypothetical protein